MKNSTIVIAVAILLVGGFLISQRNNPSEAIATGTGSSNVSMENSQQIVTITAKGGYSPQVSTVQAGVPTVIRFDTNGTFDCSAGIRIPSLGISKSLPSNGVTDVSVGSLSAGDRIQGTCSMGMYRFEVDAQG